MITDELENFDTSGLDKLPKTVICFKLLAGDVLRYSQGCLIEGYSNSISGSFRFRKIVPNYSFEAELSMRSKRQEVSHDYFLRVSKDVINNFSLLEEDANVINCFNIPGGNATRYSIGNLIEHVKINSNSCEIIDSINDPIIFKESMKTQSIQYSITDQDFSYKKSETLTMLDKKCVGIENMCSNKKQIELF
jgi:hypothetical protein